MYKRQVPWMILMAAGIFGVTMILAEVQTKRIVDPINRLNPDCPQEEKEMCIRDRP